VHMCLADFIHLWPFPDILPQEVTALGAPRQQDSAVPLSVLNSYLF
jgi:hypothetical protein